MSSLVRIVCGAILALTLSTASSFALEGYFVIVSSTPLGSEYDHESAGWAANCGYEVAEGQTYRGSGFTPGLYILYVGPFRSTWIANQVLDEILPCVPDAYVKEGTL